jgi:hypothetical protein
VRPKSYYAHVHAAADKIEPRLAKAIAKAIAKIRDGMNVNAVASQLHQAAIRKMHGEPTAKEAKAAAAAVVSPAALEAAFAPVVDILRDTILRGHRVGVQTAKQSQKAAA